MEQIIYLDPDDDILAVRDQLNLAESERVLLVVPPYSDVLRSRVDLRLVQRQAEQLKLDVALVTRDGEIGRAAAEVDLPVFGSVGQAQQRPHWRSDDEEEDWAPAHNDEAWQAAGARRSNRPASRQALVARQVLTGLLVTGVLAAFALAFVLTMPSAQITLVPRSEPINVTTYAAVDNDLSDVDVALGRIPAEYIAVEVSGQAQVPTTGRKRIPAFNATGQVVFINQLSIPVNIPRGTAVRTSAYGSVMRFFTTVDVTVPGGYGAQVQAPIEATEPGEQANVPANMINEVEGGAAISVKVTNPWGTGGGSSREVPAVAQEDRELVRSQLMQNLLNDAYFQMQLNLEENEFIPLESLFVSEVLDETYDRFVSEEAQTVALEMRVSVLGLKANMEDANTLAYAEMSARVPADYEMIADGLSFKRGGIIAPADADGDILVEVSGEGFVAPRFDHDLIRQSIVGKAMDDAVGYLEQELTLQSSPAVTITPGWWGHMPWLPLRIEIQVKHKA